MVYMEISELVNLSSSIVSMRRALLHTYAEITHIDMYSSGEILDFFRTTHTHTHNDVTS